MADKNQLQKGTGLKTTHFHFIWLGSLMPFLCSGLPIWLVCREKFTEYAFHIFLEFQINLIFFFWKGTHFIFTLKQVKRWVSLVAQTVKSLPAVQETQVWSLAQEDPLEKKMSNHSSTLAWKIPWTEEPGRLQPMGSQRVRHDWAASFSLSFFFQYLWVYLVLGSISFGVLGEHFNLSDSGKFKRDLSKEFRVGK